MRLPTVGEYRLSEALLLDIEEKYLHRIRARTMAQ